LRNQYRNKVGVTTEPIAADRQYSHKGRQ